MDDEPMWDADRVVAPTPSFAITIPKTANKFAIKGNHWTLVKGNQVDGRIKTDPHKHIHEFLGIFDMFKYRDTENEAACLMMFPLITHWRSKNMRSSGRNDYNRDNYQSHFDDKPDLQKQLSDFIKAQYSTNSFVKDTFMDLKSKLKTTTKNYQASIQNLEDKFDKFADKQSGRPSGSLISNTQPNPKVNPNDQPNDSETSINFDSDDEDEEPIPQPKPKEAKPDKETPIPKQYKPKIPYPQRLRKEKMEAQYGKFLDMIRAV
ncbi:hypothetical protein Tco_1059855 [Tanacetum coccineum]